MINVVMDSSILSITVGDCRLIYESDTVGRQDYITNYVSKIDRFITNYVR